VAHLCVCSPSLLYSMNVPLQCLQRSCHVCLSHSELAYKGVRWLEGLVVVATWSVVCTSAVHTGLSVHHR
jgi:hypothetical protein